jgi:N,N'-diacetyllegionaminate synthase
MKIADFDVSRRVLIIAEIGNNHEGDFALALNMIDRAVEACADAVKFQMIRPEQLVRRADGERLARLRSFAFSQEQFARLAQHAQSRGAMFLCTPFDIKALEFLAPLVPAIKIASGDNTHLPLLAAAARTGKPLLISTGTARHGEVGQAVSHVQEIWKAQGKASPGLALLHCVSSYPTPPEQAGLASIRRLAALPGVVAGYSDHTLGIEAAVLAVAAGARIIEKHFTLDKNQSDFRDHQLSADPAEMAEMVRRIRNCEAMLGAEDQELQACEEANIAALRRSVAAAADLPSGSILSMESLSWVRPAGGIAPGNEHLVIGKMLRRAYAAGEQIDPADLIS